MTRPEALPLSELPWPDVERLLLRLTEQEMGEVESAGLYGTTGQSQDGIDLYIRHSLDTVDRPTSPQRRYTTVQSRRLQTLSPSKIKAAVRDFLAGSWADRSRTFVYATTHPLKRTQLVAEINAQADTLEKLGITLLPWGRERISELLRSHPQIVDDFFGRDWVGIFCGPEAASALGRRLPGRDVAELRHRLSFLYQAVFSTQDTGFALLPSPDPAIPRTARFVLLDIAPDTGEEPVGSASGATDQPARDDSPAATNDPISVVAEQSRRRYRKDHPRRTLGQILQRRRIASDVSWVDVPDAVRTPADDWVVQGDLALVSGPPGSGKSTLLRHIVADLLSETPTSQALAKRFGGRLPIWLPFAFLCSHLAEGTDRSIPSAAKAWLTQQSAADLCDLVDHALEDDRLLLVVDGLDEWIDTNAAGHAFGLLEAFVSGRPVAALMSSRPYALRRLPTLARWRVGRLAPLTEQQQRSLASIAFQPMDNAHRNPSGSPTATPNGDFASTALVDRFLAELGTLTDLEELASVPLFLLLLAGVWSAEPMPTRKFTAYSRLVDLLLERHPAIRRRAAPTPGSPLRPADLRRVLASAAYRLRCVEPGLIVPAPKMRNILIKAMTDEDILALDQVTARVLADRVVDIAEDELGIMVRHGAGTVGFLHRVIAEQLAADHLSTLPLTDQRQVVGDRVRDRAWRDILLATLMLQPRPSDVEALLAVAIDHPDGSLAQLAGFEYVAEALAAGVRVTPRRANELTETVMARLVAHPWLAHRARLLVSLTAALTVPALTPVLREAFSRWVLAAVPVPAAALGVLGDPAILVDDAVALLLWGLRHHDQDVRAATAAAAARRFGGTDTMLGELAALTRVAASAEIQASALRALTEGWPDRAETHKAVGWARQQPSPVLRIVALNAVHGQSLSAGIYPQWTESERKWLLSQLDRDRMASRLWGDLDATLVAAAADGDIAIRDHCVALLRGDGQYSDGNHTLAWSVVTSAFPGHAAVTAWAAERLLTDTVFTHFYDIGPAQQWLSQEPSIVAAVEARISNADLDGLPRDLATLARLAPSSGKVRDRLIRGLDDHWAPWTAARALLELFGDDPAALEALRAKLAGPAGEAARLAYFAVDVLGLDEAITRLRDIVGKKPNDVHIAAGALARAWHLCDRVARGDADPEPDFSREAAQQILLRHPAADLAQLCLDVLPEGHDQADDDWVIVAWPDVPAVADRTRAALRRQPPRIAAVLKAFGLRTDPLAREMTAVAVQRLGYLDPELRALAAQQLGRPGVDPHLVVDLLQEWTREYDPEARRAAAVTLTQVLVGQRSTIPSPQQPSSQPTDEEPGGFGAALDRLRRTCREELQAKGVKWVHSPDIDVRRRVAWTVMLLLGEPQMLDGLNETYGSHRPVGVQLVPLLDSVDHTLAALIAKNWQTLTARLGASWINRLARGAASSSEGDRSAWAGLATVAAHNADLDAALREQVERDPSLLQEELVLAWYARSHPNDPTLPKLLFKNIDSHQGNDEPAAIALLGQLTSADQIRAWLEEPTSPDEARWWAGRTRPIEETIRGWRRVVLAQCLPTDPRLTQLYEDLQQAVSSDQRASRWGWPEAMAVTFAAAPPAVLPVLYLRFLASLQAQGAEYFGPDLLDAVARRLSRDGEAREVWATAVMEPMAISLDGIFGNRETLLDGQSPELTAVIRKTIFASMLSAASGLSPELVRDLALLHETSYGNQPTLWQSAIGVDRSTELELLEILDTAP